MADKKEYIGTPPHFWDTSKEVDQLIYNHVSLMHLHDQSESCIIKMSDKFPKRTGDDSTDIKKFFKYQTEYRKHDVHKFYKRIGVANRTKYIAIIDKLNRVDAKLKQYGMTGLEIFALTWDDCADCMKFEVLSPDYSKVRYIDTIHTFCLCRS